MKILVIGGGGREHALSWKLAQSPHANQVFCAPGNAGIAEHAECVDIAADDLSALLNFAQSNQIDLTVVGPEAPLAAGIVDLFQSHDLAIFGPRQKAAELEASKSFAKDFMHSASIPTADYARFRESAAAKAYLADQAMPIVIKQDGLAAGKGVFIAQTLAEAEACVDRFLTAQNPEIVIESFLAGEEMSCIVVANGTDYVMLEASQDHKQHGEGDTGPNTGGMGAYSPVANWTPALQARVQREIVEPSLTALEQDGRHFTGFLYVGLMIVGGSPYVLEYNVRLGDPEAQALLYRLESDLAELLLAAATNQPLPQQLQWSEQTSLCVVMSSAGYPGSYEKGLPISGLNNTAENCTVFHAGTTRQGDNIVTAGGRVLGVTGMGADIHAARALVYQHADLISWDGAYMRRDIGCRLQRIQEAS